MLLLGIDIGSSSIKLSVVESTTGEIKGSAFYPKTEMKIIALKAEWAEQDPEDWWNNIKKAMNELSSIVNLKDIEAIGITYQMHGLVCVDKEGKVLRPSIIWCDSRAVEIGAKAFKDLGTDYCLSSCLNSPGNFTASKIKWVKDNEPEIYQKIYKILLPGDYIAYRLTGELATTISGLSEGIFWDFNKNDLASDLIEYYGIDNSFFPQIVPTFGNQGSVKADIAAELGLKPYIPVTYRAGDQPNNAFSLNVLQPGEIAATAGTSGVVYAVSDQTKSDPKSRVNIFAHVNHTRELNRLGVLLCINGTGILNSWAKHNIGTKEYDYPEMNDFANSIPIGSEGLTIVPFGNGAERVIENKNPGCYVGSLNFNIHNKAHFFRAEQEGIAFSFMYGIDIMKSITAVKPMRIRAGKANMFLSQIFSKTLASLTNTPIDLYNTDGSVGAARGAGVGTSEYKSLEEAFSTLKLIETIEPDSKCYEEYNAAYQNWNELLNKMLNN